MAHLVQITLFIVLFFEVPEPGNGKVIYSSIPKEIKTLIMKTLNHFRQNVKVDRPSTVPMPPKMEPLKYSEEIEKEIQEKVNTCNINFPAPKLDGKELGIIRTRIVKPIHGNTETSLEQIVRHWLEQKRRFQYGDYSPDLGGFSQFLYDRATKVGCGFVEYDKRNDEKIYQILACAFDSSDDIPPFQTAKQIEHTYH